jgi:hypothetical protein
MYCSSEKYNLYLYSITFLIIIIISIVQISKKIFLFFLKINLLIYFQKINIFFCYKDVFFNKLIF